MTGPFTILAVSDLHINSTFFDDQKNEIEELSDFVKSSKIDFLVISGDIIDKTRGNNDSLNNDSEMFRKADEILDSLRKKCGISDPFHVIIAPGNHDLYRDSEKETTEFIKERTEFFKKSISKLNCSITEGIGKEFREKYEYSFMPFSDFYREYCISNNKNESYYWDKTLFGDNLEAGIGVIQGFKVFVDYNVVFVCINTEWNHFEDGKKKPPYLIQSFMDETFREIGRKYPGFTVISVMHRNPYDLTWSDQYAEQSPVESLYNYSDIIISGHNHSQPFFPLHRMNNRAQLLNLGTVSGRRDNVRKRNAALMKIDSFYDSLVLVNLEYDGDSGEWRKTSGSYNQYGLNPKLSSYFKGASNYFVKGFHSEFPFCCVSVSKDDTDILKAIRKSYRCQKDIDILKTEGDYGDTELEMVKIIPVDSYAEHNDDELWQTVKSHKSSGKITVFVIYAIGQRGNIKAVSETIDNKFSYMQQLFFNDILLGSVVLQKSLVEVSEDDSGRLPVSFIENKMDTEA